MIIDHSPASERVYRELCQLVAELSLISHTAGLSYEGKPARDTSEDIGGRRPPGGDHEPKPKAPKDTENAGAWQRYYDDLAAWEACYHRRTVEWFREQLGRCETVLCLSRLRDEARDVLAAWRRTPIPPGQDPEYGSAQWKRWIAESPLDAVVLARRFNVSRQYIHQIRKAYQR